MRGKLPLKTLSVLSLVLTLWPAALALADTRKPNDFELAYTAIALDTLSDQLCAKISADAETTAPFNSSGTQVYRERSRCFLYVAVTKPDTGLCREVIEVEAERIARQVRAFDPDPGAADPQLERVDVELHLVEPESHAGHGVRRQGRGGRM